METQHTTFADILEIEFLIPIGMTAAGLAERLDVPVKLVHLLLNNEIRLDARLAGRLAVVFRTTSEFWLELPLSASSENKNSDCPALQAA